MIIGQAIPKPYNFDASKLTTGNLAVARMPVSGNWTLTGDLNIGDAGEASILHIDTDNNRIGVGTNAPDSAFHIKANTPGTVGSHAAGQLIIQDPDDTVFGNVAITGYESDGAGNPDQQLWYLGSSSGGNTDITFLNRRNSKLQLGTAGTAKMTILGAGNVGIGTTAPQSLLDVQAAEGSPGLLTLATKGTTTVDGDVLGKIQFNAPLDAAGSDAILPGAAIWAEAEDTFSGVLNETSLVFATGASEEATGKVWVTSAGRVGIGTAAPVQKFHVVGGSLRSDNTGTGAGLIVNRTDGKSASLQAGFGGGNFLFDETGSFSIQAMPEANVLIAAGGSGDQVKLKINGSTGNVGIGTTSPDTKLQVVGDTKLGDDNTNYLSVGTSGNLSFTGSAKAQDVPFSDAKFPILDKASGNGIKVDTTAPTFGWRDLKGKITNSKGSTKPTEATYIDGITQFQFSAGDDAELEFHIPHDYVPGTDIHLHVHWSHISGSVAGGSIVLTYEITYAKGFNQAAFSASVTNTFPGVASTTPYQHIISEVQISASTPEAGEQIDTDDLEPDGLILCRIEMTTNNMTGATPDPFIHETDIHYQSTNIGTKQKVLDFYGEIL